MAKGKCAFCNHHGKLTREHSWPKWLHDVIPLGLKDLHHTHLTIKPIFGSFDIGFADVIRTRRSGDPGSRKLPIACSDCNNVWMSKLQERAKPILAPIILGQWIDLTEHAELIARWCIMTTMVYEYLDVTTIAIPQDERDALRRQDSLSEQWVVWIGQCPEELPNRRAAHRAYRVVDGPMTPGKVNCQATTLHVGKMLAQIVYGPLQDHGSNVLYALQTGMKLLYPNPSPTLDSQPAFQGESLIEPHQKRLTEFFETHVRGVRTVLMPGIAY